jgi:ComF family protein
MQHMDEWRPSRILAPVLDFFVPDACPVCASALPEAGRDLCEGCAGSVRPLPTPRCTQCGGAADSALEVCGECLRIGRRPWRHAVSVFPYGDTVRELVHRLKYGHQPYLAKLLGRRMGQAWQEHGTGVPDTVVAVPLHWWRHWRRGYNQAALLAEEVSQVLGLPLLPALRRQRATRRQALLDIDRRKANVKGVFAPHPRWSVRGRHVLLVDDVLTTGHTLGEATRTLLAADALAVSVLTAARG